MFGSERESSIWNELLFGNHRAYRSISPEGIREKWPQEKMELQEENYVNAPEYVYHVKEEPEEPLLAFFDDVSAEPTVVKRSKVRKIIRWLSIYIIIFGFLGVYHIRSKSGIEVEEKRDVGGQTPLSSFYTKVGSKFRVAQTKFIPPVETETDHPKNEIFTVTDPRVVLPQYGSSVYSVQLLNHTFGNSYGHPFVSTFSPPDVEFNKVVVTLTTTVNYIQYDRLAHFYVGGNEVWRTSTIEPGGSVVFSLFQKDISDFANLFKQESELIFQLDNVVNPNLLGEFNTVLTADFYQDDTEDTQFSGDYTVFSTKKPADSVYPLINSGPGSPPVVTIEDSLSFDLPSVNVNTTRLNLRFFSTGNGDEEFWYTNVIDQETNLWNSTQLGHGPIRILNVYFNDKKISTAASEPVLYTGGISPALWRPVVCIDAFDLPHFDVDLTGLLPYFWANSANSTSKNKLTIQISNGLGEVGAASSTTVGNGWITTASLLAYEDDRVIGGSGEITSTYQVQQGNLYAPPPSNTSYVQLTNVAFKTFLESSLSLNLNDGTTLRTTTTLKTDSGTYNAQNYLEQGNEQFISHYGRSSRTFIIEDGSSEPIHTLKTSFQYPFVLDLVYYQATENYSEYTTTVNHLKGLTVELDSNTIVELVNGQESVSEQILSTGGNSGVSSGTTNITVDVNTGSSNFEFQREVTTENNTVTLDESSRGGFTTLNVDNGPTYLNYANFFQATEDKFQSDETSQVQAALQGFFNDFTSGNQW